MELLDQLRAEHDLIDAVVGSLVAAADTGGGTVPAADLPSFLAFLRHYAADFHHDGEEDRLFPALVEHAEVRADRGPLAILVEDHRTLAGLVATLAAEAGSRASVRLLARAYWEHVDKENSVLLPEAHDRLRRNGVTTFAGRQPSPEQERARQLGVELVRHYPPADDPGVVRGDGCIQCWAFGSRCAGIEKEWWNTWEWQYHRSLDDG